MATQPTCLVCQKVMEPGFIPDRGDSNAMYTPRWFPGSPKPPDSFLGIKVGELNSSYNAGGHAIIAFRCPECEALRLYAPSTPTTP